MRGGRNKFGPMYKRDRARKLQVLRHRHHVHPSQMVGTGANVTLSYQAQVSGANGHQGGCGGGGTTMYSPPLHIKQEIQIPQVTSMTSSPDSSPSPVQLGSGGSHAGGGNLSGGGNTAGIAAVLASVGGSNVGGPANQSGGGGQIIAQQTDPNTGGVWQISTSPNQAKVHKMFL